MMTKIDPPKTYVFEVEYGGLGDHLFYSPLPRLLKERGVADKVYLSARSKVRNNQTLELVWKTNPYLDGIVEHAPSKFYRQQPTVNKVINLEMAKHGIVINYELDPELYSMPIKNEQLSEQKFLDLNYISYVGAITPLDEIVIALRNSNLVLINPKAYLYPFLKTKPVITSSLQEYAQIVFSAAEFHCLTSGGATLACALKKNATAYYGFGQSTIHHHSSNRNTLVGSDGFIRREISKFLKKRNLLRELNKKI
jgi:hypothetical protein